MRQAGSIDFILIARFQVFYPFLKLSKLCHTARCSASIREQNLCHSGEQMGCLPA